MLLQSLLHQTYHITCIMLNEIMISKWWWVKYASASFNYVILHAGLMRLQLNGVWQHRMDIHGYEHQSILWWTLGQKYFTLKILFDA
jgi:hypothetical protein